MEHGNRVRRSACCAAILAVSGLAACQHEAARPEKPPTMVQVEAATLTEYAPTVRLTGENRAQVESELSFRISGRVTERTVNVGDHVRADQLLARIDP